MSAEKIQVVVRVAPLDDPKGDKDCFLPSVLLLLLLLGEALEVPDQLVVQIHCSL
jgi:hypothetical protein